MNGADNDPWQANAGLAASAPAPVPPLEVVEFVAPETAAAPPSPITTSISPPGPALPEAVGWTAMVLSVQVVAMVAIMLVAAICIAVTHQGRVPAELIQIENLGPDWFAALSGLPGFLGYLVLIPLACWRISPQPLRKLNFSRPSMTQALIVTSCVLPLGTLSDLVYSVVLPVWEQFLEQIPVLHGLRGAGLDQAMSQMNGAALPLLLFFLSVVPAVGEEWMLRGLIGRGLVARWGIAGGVIWTSILFAVMHLDPPHVAAVFPIGIMLHVVYLTTRSFWMPILYHFLNNATVSVFTTLGAAEPGTADDGTSWLAYAAVPYLCVAVALLWKLRTRYVAADGREARRDYFSFEHYPEEEARRVAPNHLLIAGLYGLLLVAQIGLLAKDLIEIQREQSQPAEQAEPEPVAARILPGTRI